MLLQNERRVELTSRAGTGGWGHNGSLWFLDPRRCLLWQCCAVLIRMTSMECGVWLRPHVLTSGGQTFPAVAYRAFPGVLIASLWVTSENSEWAASCFLAGTGKQTSSTVEKLQRFQPKAVAIAIFQHPRRGDRLRDRQTRLAVTSSEGDRIPICNLNTVTMPRRQRSTSLPPRGVDSRGPRPPLCHRRRLLTPPTPTPDSGSGFFQTL